MKTIEVYQADAFGFYLYALMANELALSPGHYNVPYGAYMEKPADAAPGMVARRIGDAWVIVEDHRSETFYRIVAPADAENPALVEAYQIGAVVLVDGQEVSYDGGGAVPAWLTTEAPQPVEQPAEPLQLEG